MSAIQVAPSGERSQGRGSYGVVHPHLQQTSYLEDNILFGCQGAVMEIHRTAILKTDPNPLFLGEVFMSTLITVT